MFGYTNETLGRFHRGWGKLSLYVAEKGNPPYTPVIGLEFLHVEVDYPAYRRFKDSQERSRMIRGVRLLNEYQEYGSIASRIPTRETEWPPELANLRNSFILHCNGKGYTKHTVVGYMNVVDPFLRAVQANKNRTK